MERVASRSCSLDLVCHWAHPGFSLPSTRRVRPCGGWTIAGERGADVASRSIEWSSRTADDGRWRQGLPQEKKKNRKGLRGSFDTAMTTSLPGNLSSHPLVITHTQSAWGGGTSERRRHDVWVRGAGTPAYFAHRPLFLWR